MKTETITILKPTDFEKLKTFINYYLFGQLELPKINPYKEYLLSDPMLEFLANYSEEIQIITDAENLYLVKVLNLFLQNSEDIDRENLIECYNHGHIKSKISSFIEMIKDKINIEIFTPVAEKSTYETVVQEKKISLEILTFLVHQLSGILSYVPKKSSSISAMQYEEIVNKYLIDHHRRKALINSFKNSNI
jgi:hypothetical protein